MRFFGVVCPSEVDDDAGDGNDVLEIMHER